MKILLIGVVALLLGVGGGAYVSGSKVKTELLAQAEQAAADSTAALLEAALNEPDDGHGPTSSDPGDHAPDGGDPAQAADSTDVHGGDSIDQTVAAALERSREQQRLADSVAVAEAAAERAAAEAARLAEEGARKLAKIFGAMQAQDAAAVLQEMSDEEVELILMQMSDRLAAQILGVFEPARAAALTRAVLGTARTGN